MFDTKIVVDDNEQQQKPEEQGTSVPISNTPKTTQGITPPPKDSGNSFEVPAPKPEKKKRKSSKGLIITLSIAGVLILGVGGVYAAYVRGVIDIPFLDSLLVKKGILTEVVENIQSVQSGKTDVALTLAVEPKTDQAKPLTATNENGLSASEKSKISDLKQRISIFRTALVLYFDDEALYPKTLDELEGTYLVDASQSDISYVQLESGNGFLLEGKLKIGGTERIYSINEEGTEVDTFPTTSSTRSDDYLSFLQEAFSMIPGDVEVSASFSQFVGPTTGTAIPDSEGTFSARYSASGTQLEVAFDSRTKNGKAYGRVTKIPAIEFLDIDTTSILNTWIIIDEDEVFQQLQPYQYMIGGTNVEQSEVFNQEDMERLFKSVLESMIDKEFVAVQKKADKKIFGSTQYDAYLLDVRPEFFGAAISDFLEKEISYCLTTECVWEALGGDAEDVDLADLPQALSEMEQSGIIDFLSAFTSASELTLYVGENNAGYVLEGSTVFLFPDDMTTLANKQGRIQWSISLTEINQSPQVEAPEETITLDDVMRLVSGQTEEEWKYGQQVSVISNIRLLLAQYESSNGDYPGSLDEIVVNQNTTTTNEISSRGLPKYAQLDMDFSQFELPTIDTEIAYPQGMNPFDSTASILSPFSMLSFPQPLTELPTDIYTGKPFEYTKGEGTYSLKYTLKLPTDSTTIPASDLEQYVDGINTANHQVLSVEANSTKDFDEDGLTGAQEAKYGTNPTNKDTDGDGATDFEEIQEETDPLDAESNPESKLGGVDTDEDGLSDLEEKKYGTNVRLKDTDLDGFTDKNEIDAGYNPLSTSTIKTYGMRVADGEWIVGGDEPKITMVVFIDYESNFSSQYNTTLQSVLETYPNDIRIVYKHYPLSAIHPNAQIAAEAAECAGAQGKFWDMHEMLFDGTGTLTRAKMTIFAEDLDLHLDTFDACLNENQLADRVTEDREYGELLEISGTPTTFINGDEIAGAKSLSDLSNSIDSYLEEL